MTSDANSVGKRILVLGSQPHSRFVKAYPWDRLPRGLNVADFDVVVLNLMPLLGEESGLSFAWKTFPSQQQFNNLIFSRNSEIIVIGVPNVPIQGLTEAKTMILNTWWLPVFINSKHETGETVKLLDSEFKYYFERLSNWHFVVPLMPQTKNNVTTDLSLVFPGANIIRPILRPIATNRYENCIAFKIILQVKFEPEHHSRYGPGNKPQERTFANSSEIIWLPPLSEFSPYETVNLILRNRYGIALEQEPPNWVAAYKLPNQVPIEVKIREIEGQIAELKNKLIESRRNLAAESRFLKLLYGEGEDVLEPVVRDALRELGASVNKPLAKGREDGRLIAPTNNRKAVIEIKSSSKSLRLREVRQLRKDRHLD